MPCPSHGVEQQLVSQLLHQLAQGQLRQIQPIPREDIVTFLRGPASVQSHKSAAGAVNIGPSFASTCVKRGDAHAVCSNDGYLDGVTGAAREGLHLGAIPATRRDGRIDCLGDCNELHRPCAFMFYTASCFSVR